MTTTPGARTDGTSNPVDADNSGKNKRDSTDVTLTPMDQGGSEADRSITARIRKEIVDDKTISMYGQNAKIITINGKVTLRGPVASVNERERIGQVAKRVAGVVAVDNQLEVTEAK